MASRLPSLLLLVAVLSAAAHHAYSAKDYPSTGWTRIKGVEEQQHAVDIARFAIGAYNRKMDDSLLFVRMIRGYVNGKYYKLTITCIQREDRYEENVKDWKYETLVYEEPNMPRQLIYFKDFF
ncbi:uncharacterized protein LOC144702530 [Wolffia australiana]